MNKFATLSFYVLVAATIISFIQPDTVYQSHYLLTALDFCESHELCRSLLKLFRGDKEAIDESSKPIDGDRIFTADELSKYKGENGGQIFLAMFGKVFDVSRGTDFYGPGGGYHFFAGTIISLMIHDVFQLLITMLATLGIDGTRAFVSGDFTEAGLVDDVAGLQAQDYLGLGDWMKFYEKDYKFVG